MAGMGKELSREEAIRKIKEVILSTAEKFGIKVEKIILFGSRARGDYKKESDWDILIVGETEVDRVTERKFLYECTLKLLELDIDAEIIMVSRSYYLRNKGVVGDICGIAMLEGRVL